MSDEPLKTRRRTHFAVGPFILSMILTGMVGWSLYQAFMSSIPSENQRIIDMLLGNIMAVWFGSMAYWFNTTFGSQAKGEVIAKSGPVDPNA